MNKDLISLIATALVIDKEDLRKSRQNISTCSSQKNTIVFYTCKEFSNFIQNRRNLELH